MLRSAVLVAYALALRWPPPNGDTMIKKKVDPRRVKIVDDVGAKVFELVDKAAKNAIEDKGHFFLGIPGGSILEMLAGTSPEWAAQTTVVWVNHKCVPLDDATSTSAKAKELFLNAWEGCKIVDLKGGPDSIAEANSYDSALRALEMPVNFEGGPVFDAMLVGVGDDGHIGSLYPERPEIACVMRWVLPCMMKIPASITLSLPVIDSARSLIVAATGTSTKYPEGKAEAIKRALETEESLFSFPATGLRPYATYVLDKAAASALSSDYTTAA